MSAPTAITLHSSQGHPRIVCHPDDARLAFPHSESGGAEQMGDDPPMIVIGRETTDEKCARLAVDHGVDAAALIAFRDGTAPETPAEWLNTQLPTQNPRLRRALEICRGKEDDGLFTTYRLAVDGDFKELEGAGEVYVDPTFPVKAGDIAVVWPDVDADPELFRLVTAPPPAEDGDWRTEGDIGAPELLVISRRTGKPMAIPMRSIAAVHPVIGHGPAERAA